MEELPGDYIAGFIDGEGCFVLNFRKDIRNDRKNKPIYFYWKIGFKILLKNDDKKILKKIKNTLKCGTIFNSNKTGITQYSIDKIDELSNKLVPFFLKYPLKAKKRFDLELWTKALDIFKVNQKKWTEKDKKEILIIRNLMKQYKGGNKSNWKWLPK